ncbi:MAG: hypothetical protein WDN44_15270 [Sphingomonas sp.]
MIAGVAWALAATLQQGTIDWAALPSLPYRAPPAVTDAMDAFVAREARARRCPLPPASGAAQTMTVELAVLIQGDGGVRAVVPRAINCATVEQYAAGLVAAFARSNLVGASEQWYRTSLTFSWTR